MIRELETILKFSIDSYLYRNIFILKEESCNMNDFYKIKIWILYYIIFLLYYFILYLLYYILYNFLSYYIIF